MVNRCTLLQVLYLLDENKSLHRTALASYFPNTNYLKSIYLSCRCALTFFLYLNVSCSVTVMTDPLLLVIVSIIAWTNVGVRWRCPVSAHASNYLCLGTRGTRAQQILYCISLQHQLMAAIFSVSQVFFFQMQFWLWLFLKLHYCCPYE